MKKIRMLQKAEPPYNITDPAGQLLPDPRDLKPDPGDPNFALSKTTGITDQRDEGGGVGRQHGQSLLRGRSNLLEPTMTNEK